MVALPHPARIVSILAEAMAYRKPSSAGRLFAGDYPVLPTEGLRVIELYTSIEDDRVRQALLDALVSITENFQGLFREEDD